MWTRRGALVLTPPRIKANIFLLSYHVILREKYIKVWSPLRCRRSTISDPSSVNWILSKLEMPFVIVSLCPSTHHSHPLPRITRASMSKSLCHVVSNRWRSQCWPQRPRTLNEASHASLRRLSPLPCTRHFISTVFDLYISFIIFLLAPRLALAAFVRFISVHTTLFPRLCPWPCSSLGFFPGNFFFFYFPL